jgi:hypothetical protein
LWSPGLDQFSILAGKPVLRDVAAATVTALLRKIATQLRPPEQPAHPPGPAALPGDGDGGPGAGDDQM